MAARSAPSGSFLGIWRGAQIPLPLGEDTSAAQIAFQECIAAACAREPWLTEHPVEIEWWGGQFASVQTEPNSRIIKNLEAAHAHIVGVPLEEYVLVSKLETTARVISEVIQASIG